MTRPDSTLWMTDGLRRLGALLRDHAALAFLLLTSLGACYEFFLYLHFRINIFQFAEPLDLLFAAIRQPVIAIFSVLPLGLLWLLGATDRWQRRVFPWYGRMAARNESRPGYAGLYRVVQVVFVVIYFVYFTLRYADFVADRLRDGKGRPISAELAGGGGSSGPRLLTGTLLGTTSKYIFVYQHADSSTHVVPVESITEMVVLQGRHDRKSSPPRALDSVPPR